MSDLVLYDGVCGLCDRFVGFVLKRDRAARFRFAPLQGTLAERLLARYGRRAQDLDTVCVVVALGEPNEHLLVEGRAAIHVLAHLGGPWRLARLLRALPPPVIDAADRSVARRRYRWFGRRDACALPPPEHRARFLERDAPA